MLNPSQHSSHSQAHSLRARRALSFIAMGSLIFSVLLYASDEANAGGKSGAAPTPLSKDELMVKGKEIYNQTCSGCHRTDGMGIPSIYPSLVAGAAFSGAEFLTKPLEKRGFLKDGKIQLSSIENHIDVVVNGIPNSRMVAFSELFSDAEIAAIVTYERNAWGNNSGDVIQPAQIKAARP